MLSDKEKREMLEDARSAKRREDFRMWQVKMRNRYLQELKKLTLEALEGEKVKIILFGSRARQDNHLTSDVDIGLIPSGRLDKRKVILLKERIEGLNIPYKVEIVDFSTVSSDFKKQAMKGAVIWKG